MMVIIKVFLAFLKIGAFSFGGGMAMIPFIEREVVTKYGWISKSEFLDVIGISQMTPGPIAINSATFVGYKVCGIPGSLIASVGVVLVAFILVIIASKTLAKFKENKKIQGALLGMKPVIIALVINAFISLSKESYHDIKSLAIAAICMFLILVKKVHPILVIVIAACLGVAFYI